MLSVQSVLGQSVPRRLPATLLMAVFTLPGLAAAHPLTFTDTTVVLRADGTFQIDLITDLDALALGVPQDADDASLVATLTAMTPADFNVLIDRLRTLFERRVRLRFDGEPSPFDVDFPDYGTTAALESDIPTLLGLTARLTGTIPAGATDVEFFASRAFSEVNLTVQDEARGITTRAVLERGARSEPFALAGPAKPAGMWSAARQYLGLGFAHIVPQGLDHVLFVFGLFLFSTQLRPLVWQVTAFTVAHAVTLSLALYGVVSLPPALVEPLIALSIVYIGVENVMTERLTKRRAAVVFSFGLLHGLGFAGALRTLGLPQQEQLLGLVSFNVGIELGQLAVLTAALSTLGWWRHRGWYRSRLAVPLSLAIAAIGVVWTVERFFGA